MKLLILLVVVVFIASSICSMLPKISEHWPDKHHTYYLCDSFYYHNVKFEVYSCKVVGCMFMDTFPKIKYY